MNPCYTCAHSPKGMDTYTRVAFVELHEMHQKDAPCFCALRLLPSMHVSMMANVDRKHSSIFLATTQGDHLCLVILSLVPVALRASGRLHHGLASCTTGFLQIPGGIFGGSAAFHNTWTAPTTLLAHNSALGLQACVPCKRSTAPQGFETVPICIRLRYDFQVWLQEHLSGNCPGSG